jgi:hypothetical protein
MKTSFENNLFWFENTMKVKELDESVPFQFGFSDDGDTNCPSDVAENDDGVTEKKALPLTESESPLFASPMFRLESTR